MAIGMHKQEWLYKIAILAPGLQLEIKMREGKILWLPVMSRFIAIPILINYKFCKYTNKKNT